MRTYRYPRTILASAVVPWNSDGEFNEEIFRREIEVFSSHDLNHIYIFGTAGEGYAVSDQQYRRVVSVFAEAMTGDGNHPMVGVISLSQTTILERIKYAYDRGIRDFMISLPSWGALANDELFSFFHDVCDPFPDCRFMNYNLARTKRLLTVEEFEALAEAIPNLAAVKFSSADLNVIADMALSDCPIRFFVLDLALRDANYLGECGWVIALGVSNLPKAWRYFQACVDKNLELASAYWIELFQLQRTLLKTFPSARIDGAYDKVLTKCAIPELPLRLLPPYQAATEEEYQCFIRLMRHDAQRWLPLTLE